MSTPELELDVLIEDEAWTRAIPEVGRLCRTAAAAAHARAAQARDLAPGASEACLVLADDSRVHALNREFRGRDEPTDVLSFPAVELDVLAAAGAEGPPALLGDVAIAFGVASADAERDGRALADHLCHLVVHAILHLWAFDHEAPADAAVMEALETEILGSLGIDDPYADADEHRDERHQH